MKQVSWREGEGGDTKGANGEVAKKRGRKGDEVKKRGGEGGGREKGERGGGRVWVRPGFLMPGFCWGTGYVILSHCTVTLGYFKPH